MSEEQAIPEVDPGAAFESVSAERGIVLDVREQDELMQVSISGALHIPLGELHQRSGDLPSDKDVYVLCHVGQRSAMATDYLRQAGHARVWNIRGGIIGWVRAGLPADWPGRTG